MAAPTFIQDAESAFNTSTTPKAAPTAGTFSVLAADVLVDAAGIANANGTLGTPSGGSLTWTSQENVGSGGNAARAALATAIVDTNKSMSVSETATGGLFWGHTALTFRDSDGIGAAESSFISAGSAAPSLAITTTQDNSAIVMVIVDWNAVDLSAPTWRQVNGANPTSVTYFRDSSQYTVQIAYYADAGLAGAKTVGFSSPSTARCAIAAIEIKGTAGGGGGTVVKQLAALGVG